MSVSIYIVGGQLCQIQGGNAPCNQPHLSKTFALDELPIKIQTDPLPDAVVIVGGGLFRSDTISARRGGDGWHRPAAVIGRLRGTTLNYMYVNGGRIRADGTMLHDMYLLRVKTPAQSTDPWDVYDHRRALRRRPQS